jgi:hypothetical protein
MSHTWIVYLLSRLVSIVQAASLRERYYLQQQRIEIMLVALEDIQRINRRTCQDTLIERICTSTIHNEE